MLHLKGAVIAQKKLSRHDRTEFITKKFQSAYKLSVL